MESSRCPVKLIPKPLSKGLIIIVIMLLPSYTGDGGVCIDSDSASHESSALREAGIRADDLRLTEANRFRSSPELDEDRLIPNNRLRKPVPEFEKRNFQGFMDRRDTCIKADVSLVGLILRRAACCRRGNTGHSITFPFSGKETWACGP